MMKVFTVICIVALAVKAGGTFGYPEEDDVLVLTDELFPKAIAEFEYILVEFYAPWCGHCKKLAPEYSKAAAQLKKLVNPLPIAKVDATVHKESSKKYGVTGFPTIKFFINGKPIEFKGARTAEGIVEWVQKKTQPATSLIENEHKFEEIVKKEKTLAIYFTHEETESKGFEAFKKVALKYDNIPFYYVQSSSLYERFNNNPQRFAIHTEHKPFHFLEEGKKIDEASITAHIEAHRFPTVIPFETPDALSKIFGGQKNAIVYFSQNHNAQVLEAYTAIAEEEASVTKKPLLFSKAIYSSEDGKRISGHLGQKPDTDSVWIINPKQTSEKYKLAGDISGQSIIEFIALWREGKVEREIKSGPVPATNNQPVKVIVGKNFDEFVTNTKKWVLLEVYAPWCGHCKKLAPIYDQLAKDLAYMDNLVIAKMDGTENEIQNFQAKGYPTLKLFTPNNRKTPVDFTGDRTLEGLKKTLKTLMRGDYIEKGEEVTTDL